MGKAVAEAVKHAGHESKKPALPRFTWIRNGPLSLAAEGGPVVPATEDLVTVPVGEGHRGDGVIRREVVTSLV